MIEQAHRDIIKKSQELIRKSDEQMNKWRGMPGSVETRQERKENERD
jgi:hypothetical protein